MRRVAACLALAACAAAHRSPNTEAADAAPAEEGPTYVTDEATGLPDAYAPPHVNDAAPPPVDAWQPPPQDAGAPPDTAPPPPPPAVDAGPVTVCQIISQLTHPDVPCPTTGTLFWFNQTTGSVGQCTDAGWTNVDGQRQNCPAGEYCQYRDLDGGVYTGVCHL